LSSASGESEVEGRLLDRGRNCPGESGGDSENPERNEDLYESQDEVGSKELAEVENE